LKKGELVVAGGIPQPEWFPRPPQEQDRVQVLVWFVHAEENGAYRARSHAAVVGPQSASVRRPPSWDALMFFEDIRSER
jgi:hypothetical protein